MRERLIAEGGGRQGIGHDVPLLSFRYSRNAARDVELE